MRVGSLREIVRDARARTGVPGVAAGVLRDGAVETCADGVLQLGSDTAVRPETPFRIASISKPFTASLALSCLPLGGQLVGWLSHTAGFVCESEAPLPEGAEGLFSYSNAGYWAAGREVARVSGTSFEDAMRERILEPLGLEATGYDDPGAAAARGHLQEGETGHRAVADDVYPVERRPSGGLWSTVGDLLRFAAHHLGGPGPLSDQTRAAMREPQSQALGAGYGLGWWVHDAGGRAALDHEGSVAGYQSLLLLVPEERARARSADEQLARQRARAARRRGAGARSRRAGRRCRAQPGSDPRPWPDGTPSATRRPWSRRPATVCSSRRPTSIP